MKTSYFERLCLAENLYLAYYKASRHKKTSNSYLLFRKKADENLLRLQKSLIKSDWEPGLYRQFKIKDPKERIITAAPFEDRILHHAIINVTEELFEKKYIFHTYACRKEKGSHAALGYAEKFCIKKIFFLKLDIKKYFDSIDHMILKEQLKRLINEKAFTELFSKIIDSYTSEPAKEKNLKKGLPIGNLTSQYFANLYLSGLDHYILEKLRPKGYERYMDDMLIFSPSIKELKQIYNRIQEYTKEKLDLELKTPVFGRTQDGIPFLGKLVKKQSIRPLSEKMRLKKKKIKEIDYLVRHNKISQEKGAERINAIIADSKTDIKK